MAHLLTYKMRNFPVPFKALAVGYLMALGFSYFYALANIALVVGLSTKDIAKHYYGSEKRIVIADTGGEQKLDLGQLSDQSSEPPPQQPSLKNLVTEGHFHLFGMTSFFFGLTLMGLFTGVREQWKTVMVSLPYFTVILDNLSFMATRFLGPKLAFLTAGAGGIMALSFTWLWLAVMVEIIKNKEV